ncbi:MAG: hypothetical protein ACSLE6_06615 [Mycobacterium sp.]
MTLETGKAQPPLQLPGSQGSVGGIADPDVQQFLELGGADAVEVGEEASNLIGLGVEGSQFRGHQRLQRSTITAATCSRSGGHRTDFAIITSAAHAWRSVIE